MGMQDSMGQLKEAVGGLKESRTQQNLKLDKIIDDIHTIKTKIYAAVAIVLIAGSVTGAILGIFGKPIVELIFNRGTAPKTSTPTK
jgi:peptidoglycan biosynthesis protein MviN/MurJ (putative lipid II flippase)